MYRNSFQILKRGLREMQSSNPYLRQIGARRLLGYTTTVGIAAPMMKKWVRWQQKYRQSFRCIRK